MAQTQYTGIPTPSRPRSRRGFASMDPALQRQIARLGGQRAHALGTAHEWTSEEAAAAGRRGGSLKRGGQRVPAAATLT